MKKNISERGQVLVIVALVIIGIVGITGLAIDGSIVLADRRQAQNAADSAAMAGALARIKPPIDPDTGNLLDPWTAMQNAARDRAESNGYFGDLVYSQIEIYDCEEEDASCPVPYAGDPNYIQVVIHSHVDTSFAQIVGVTQLHNRVQAVALAQSETELVPFNGNSAVVGLNPDGYGFDAWGNSEWNIYGGGIFSNDDARAKNNKDNVHFPDGNCVTAVGTASYFHCPVSDGNSDLAYEFPDDIIPLLPPIPPCDGVAYRGVDGKLHEQVGKEGRGSTVNHFEDSYAPGIYCITNADGNFHGTTSGTGVTFYISDTNFTMKFNGGGGWAVQAPTNGPYKGVLMFSNVTPTPCTQNLEYRGNGVADNIGTIFMPSACIDARGNSDANQNRSQVIGYTVTTNGGGTVNLYYDSSENYYIHLPPKISLVK